MAKTMPTPVRVGTQAAPGRNQPAVRAAAVHTRRRPRRDLFAAIDLGTNNCRLLVAHATSHNEFQVVDAFSRVVRLGDGLHGSGRMSEEAMDRAIEALKACADKLNRRRVGQVRSVATEACRKASNGAEFVRRVYQETGIALDVISPAEEARLAVLGCQTLIDHQAPATLVFDIGGGSTEVILLERWKNFQAPERIGGSKRHLQPGFANHGIIPKFEGTSGLGFQRMRRWISIPWGVVSLADTEPLDAGNRSARLDAYLRMKERVAKELRPLERLSRVDMQLLGASGTVTTLASLNMGLTQYDRQRVDGTWAATSDLVALSHSLVQKSPEERAAVPGVGADRAELMVAGSAILEALVDLGGAPMLRVADRGIREGILRGLIARHMGTTTTDRADI